MFAFRGICLLLLPLSGSPQDIDRKAFCKELNEIVTAFAHSKDSLKGEYVGENKFGIQQWVAKYPLPGAMEKFYEHTSLESTEEFRATYVMKESAPQKEAEGLYKQIVQAVRWCYGGDYLLNEKETSEWDNNGKIHQHHEAAFTYTGAEDKGIKMPVILIRSYSIKSGLYSVDVELWKVE